MESRASSRSQVEILEPGFSAVPRPSVVSRRRPLVYRKEPARGRSIDDPEVR
jgi:hypothetical protein